MFTTAPRLCTRRPSPTTAEFIVTTLPPQTLPLRVLRLLLLCMRIGLTAVILLTIFARWICTPPETCDSLASSSIPWRHDALPVPAALTPILHPLAGATAGVSLRVLIPATAVALSILSRRIHSTESLLVLRGLGVQTSQSAGSYFWGPSTRFLPTEKVRDVLINEAFRGWEVRYYLVVVVEDEEDVIVVFPGLLPKREIVETVWRGVRECLYEGRAEDVKMTS